MRKCWNCGQPTTDNDLRVCSDDICQRAEKKSSNGELIVRTTTVRAHRKKEAAKAAALAAKAKEAEDAKKKADADAKAAKKAKAKHLVPSRARMKKAMQDLGMTKELKLYFKEE